MGEAEMDVDSNFASADPWTGDAMRERLTWLRENEPIYWSEETGIWIVTRYRDVELVSKNQEVFTSAQGVRPGTETIIGLIDEDEPRHGHLRTLINKGFTPRMVRILEEKFRTITTDAVDAIADKSECDFVESIAVPLPILLIAEMIGIRQEDQERFHHWSDALIAADGNRDKPEVMAGAAAAYMEYASYLTDILEERRQSPLVDLVSILVGAKDDGLLRTFDKKGLAHQTSEEHRKAANDELIMLLVILMIAGNETTRNAISGGMELLIRNPGERQKLLDDPKLLPSAVEEMVRMVSPVQTFGRTLTRDYELSGKQLREGQEVCLVYPAANRDPEVFDDPDSFRVERNPQHLGFGIGSHFCLGANLARMEMRVAFEELLQRVPDMEFSRGGPSFRPSSLVRSCSEMWVSYTPETQA
jgi:cytochrome P450 family 142 subfamily A polypeptide 1